MALDNKEIKKRLKKMS